MDIFFYAVIFFVGLILSSSCCCVKSTLFIFDILFLIGFCMAGVSFIKLFTTIGQVVFEQVSTLF
jgi:hypothetical protein